MTTINNEIDFVYMDFEKNIQESNRENIDLKFMKIVL